MPELAHRFAPHDELVRIAFQAGRIGLCMPNLGYLTGLSRTQAETINEAYADGRRKWLVPAARSRS